MISRFGLPLILAAFVLLAGAYSVIVPLGEAPDEVPHFSYIQYLVLHRQLPPPEGAVTGESHQPPLYYFLGAAATAWIPQRGYQVIANPDFAIDKANTPNLLVHDSRESFPYRDDVLAWHLARLLSIAMGAVTVWATWRIAREFFPDEAWVALGAAAFVAFLPGFIFISAVVNNDNLITMLSSLCILQVIRIMRQSLTTHAAIVLGVLLGLAALTKLSGFVVWVFAGTMLMYVAYRNREVRKIATPIALCFGVAIVMIIPQALHNLVTRGDPFGWFGYLAVVSARESPMSAKDWADLGRGLASSFWGRFGGAIQIRLPSAIYAVFSGLSVFGVLGWIGYARDARRDKLYSGARAILFSFAVFGMFLLTAYTRWAAGDLAAGQVRLLFPGLSLFAIFLIAGLARLAGSNLRFVVIAWSGLLFALAVYALYFLKTIYA